MEKVKELQKKREQSEIIYKVEDGAPWHISIVYIFQLVLSVTPSLLGPCAIIHSLICGGEDYVFLAQLVGTSVFMLGISTVMQIAFGIRLPLLQGSSLIFIAPIAAMMASDRYKCPDLSASANVTDIEPPWSPRIRAISGSLMVGSIFQVIFSWTGIFGLLIPYIGPLTIAPAMGLLGLTLYQPIIGLASPSWGIAILVVAIWILFSAGLRNVKVPVLSYSSQRGLHCGEGYYLFRLLPKVAAIGIAWLVSYSLTATDVFPNDTSNPYYRARTDVKVTSVTKSSWFYFPLPGQWGTPTVDAGLVVSMIMASLMGMVESVGDYYILARACEKPPPPRNAINRGLGMEGFLNIICGALNMGHGTASFSEPLAFLRITGGLNLLGFGMIAMAGLSNLQFVNLNASRNYIILAASLMTGMTIPYWLNNNMGAIKTGNKKADEVFTYLFTSPMFLGAIIGFLLDNLCPGTLEDRGILAYRSHLGMSSDESKTGDSELDIYDLPLISKKRFGDVKCCTYCPCLPTHQEREFCSCCNRRKVGDTNNANIFVTSLGDEPKHTYL